VDTLFLLPEPLPLGRVMALLMLPAQEAWRIRRSCIHRSAWKGNSPKFALTEF
jgi:hypothetical protein